MAVNHLWWDWAIKPDTPAGWYVRSVGAESREVFQLLPEQDGTPLAVVGATMTPGHLSLQVDGGTIEFAWADTSTLLIRARGCQLRLRAVLRSYANAYEHNGIWTVVPDTVTDIFACKALRGMLSSDCGWRHTAYHAQVKSLELLLQPAPDGVAELALCSAEVAPRFPRTLSTFEAAVERMAGEFARFLAAFPPVATRYNQARDVAAYVLWVSTVAPRGNFTVPAVLMSKNWMDRVWSWDHCFTALGLARAHPDLAWQQFCLPFQSQHSLGMLPDAISARQVSWACTKSPIHGWALQRMLGMTSAITDEHLHEIYGPLGRWARFWMRERDFDGTGIPYYISPNEQFDNTTLSQLDAPYQSPDLCGYLVLLHEVLAEIAERLKHSNEAVRWREDALRLQKKIVPYFWRDGKFVSPRYGDGAIAPNECVFRYAPVVLGRRLSPQIADTMRADLRQPGRWLTPSGALATEALDSPFYNSESYVRGPVWAPPNLLIHDGLRELGDHALAASIAEGFCHLCAQYGMAECFDARTGAARRDPAYTWTAGAFLILVDCAAEAGLKL
jgi:putative isomerase